tara:strand:+ start:600 stop:791 length:192 start_codon:yes stop_codon:yes gene_type:complete
MWNKIHLEMDYDNHILDGVDKDEAIKIISMDWSMTQEEVRDIINIYEKSMNDIDKTNNLGDII